MAANGQGFAKVGNLYSAVRLATKDSFLLKAKLLKLNYILQLIGQIQKPNFSQRLCYTLPSWS